MQLKWKHMLWQFAQLTWYSCDYSCTKNMGTTPIRKLRESPPLISSPTKACYLCWHILQSVKQWGTQENASICSWKIPSTCNDQWSFAVKKKKCCSSRFSISGLAPSKTCVIAAGCGARGLIRWPCGLTITRPLSSLRRLASGGEVLETQQMQPTVLVKMLPLLRTGTY